VQRGETALLLAATSNNTAAVDELLRRRADPNLPDNTGDTALFASLRRRLTAVAEALLRDDRTALSAHGKEAAKLVDAANRDLVRHIIARAQAAARCRRAPKPAPRRPCLDVAVYTVLGLGCAGLAAVHDCHPPEVGSAFSDSASFFLLPVFALALLYSFRG
jgi:hypothetical protein